MYAALNEEGQLEYAVTVDAIKGLGYNWKCSVCGQKVIWKKSAKGTCYFAHIQACGKGEANQLIERRESEMHKQTKNQMAVYFRERGYTVEMELYIPQTDQYADVFIQDKEEGVVIEFQKSIISATQLIKRTRDYMQMNYRCIWLIDFDSSSRERMTQWHCTMLQYDASLGFYLLFYYSHHNSLLWRTHLPVLYQSILDCEQTETDLAKLLHYIPSDIINQSGKIKIGTNKKDYNYTKRLYTLTKSKHYVQLLKSFYIEGITLQDLPPWLLTQRWHCLLTKTAGWIVLSWVYIELSRLSEAITYKDFKHIIVYLIKKQRIVMNPMPFVSSKQMIVDELSQAIFIVFVAKKVISYDKFKDKIEIITRDNNN